MTASPISNFPFSEQADPLNRDVVPETVARPHNNCYWVIPGRFLAGEYPGAYRPPATYLRLQLYLQVGITHFIDLTDPSDDLVPYDKTLKDAAKVAGVATRYNRLPIQDMSVPSHEQMVEILDTIDTALAAGENIYVHCWGGVGRTGTVVGSYLVRHGLPGDAALAQLADWWQYVEKSARNPRSPETDAQAAMIRQWQE